nr:MAG TPA: hypothetical protein [Caudoviricetes sp.]
MSELQEKKKWLPKMRPTREGARESYPLPSSPASPKSPRG